MRTGTLRSNLDPFGESSDLVLWQALRRVGLSSHTDDEKNAKAELDYSDSSRDMRLDTVIDDNGSNFSVGEKALISLARALVKVRDLAPQRLNSYALSGFANSCAG